MDKEMGVHSSLRYLIFIALLVSILFFSYAPREAFSHKTDVHGYLTGSSIDISDIFFQPSDKTRIKEGSVDEDKKSGKGDRWTRYRDHHYNPLTGEPGNWEWTGTVTAVEAAIDRWTLMTTAFSHSDRRHSGDISDGVQGSMHAIGRVLHLLQDMAAPPHVHPKDGHGWLNKEGPGGSSGGYYSDFEEVWSPGSTEYQVDVWSSDTSWNHPLEEESLEPLTPKNAPYGMPNSRLDAASLNDLRSKLFSIPEDERDQIQGYMEAMAWINYFHSSFYGQIIKDQQDPAPNITSDNKENILSKMFPDRIEYVSGENSEYWSIDGVGYFGKDDQYFPQDWWPCPGDYPEGHAEQTNGIKGRFYIYLHYYAKSFTGGWDTPATPPDYWPDTTPNDNNKSLAQYYGEVLLPFAARFGAGLMRELFPAPGSLSYPDQSENGQYEVSWKPVNATDAGSPNAYRLERSNDGGDTWKTVHIGKTTSKPQNVEPGHYRYRVRAQWFNPPLLGDWYVNESDVIVPFVGEEVTITSLTPGSSYTAGDILPLQWTNIEVLGDYVQIELSRDSGNSWSLLEISHSNTGSYNWTATTPASNICIFRVTSTSNSSIFAQSGEFSITESDSPFIPPDKPTNPKPGTTISPGSILDSTITLSWDQSDGADRYGLGVRDLETNQLVVDEWVYNNSLTVTLEQGKLYRWNVRACSDTGCSNFTPRLYFQTKEPGAPILISPVDGATSLPTRPTFMWEPVSEADGYNLFVYDNEGAFQLSTSDISLTLPSANELQKGKSYSWFVYPEKNGTFWGDVSRVWKFSTVGYAGDYQPFPDTGQTMCYDADNNAVPCDTIQPGDPYFGQDPHYQPRIPRSYTKLGYGGVELPDSVAHVDDGGPWIMTRDNVTGLIWELKRSQSPHLQNKNNTYSWFDPNPITNEGRAGTQDGGTCTGSNCDTYSYIQALNEQNIGGYDDWRLPSIKELSSLINAGKFNIAINTDWFPKMSLPSVFWSSNVLNNFNGFDDAWIVNFSQGWVLPHHKFNGYYIRAVRAGQLFSSNLEDNQDGTVTDITTGLMWQKCSYGQEWDDINKTCTGNAMTRTWQQAIEAAGNMTLAGYNDWRLPNHNELHSLVEYTQENPSIASVLNNYTESSHYWSSTTFAGNTDSAWPVSFSIGGNYYGSYKSNNFYFRTVRAGHSDIGSFGHLRVSIEPEMARDAGAQWRRKGTSTWYNSGETENNVPVGEHLVEFKSISGWLDPADISVTVEQGQTATAVGTYVSIELSLESVNPGQGIHGQDLQVEIKGSGFNEDTRIALIPDTRKEPSIGSVPGFAHDVMVIDDIAYIADGSGGLQVIDVSNPHLPEIIGSVPGSALDVMVIGNTAYVANWSDGLQVIDVSNPHSPEIIGSVATPGMSTGVSVVGDTAFIQARGPAFGDDGGYLHIVDISNPSSPSIIGTLDTPKEPLEYPGEVCGMTVVGDTAYVADSALLIIDVSNPQLPEIIGSVTTPGFARDVMVIDNIAYVADGSGGLQVVDVSNPHLPEIIGSVATPGSADQAAQGVMVIGNTAYIADGSGGLQVVDVSNPHLPEIIGSVATPGSARQVMVVDNTAYVADGAGGLQVIDVKSAFYNPIIGSLETPGIARNIVVTDNTAYIADGYWFIQQGDFQIIDISNPTSPEIIGSLEVPGYSHCAKDVSIVGEKAYLIYGYKSTVNDVPHVEGGLLVIDVSIPSSPVIIGSVQTPGAARGVTVVGDTAYIIDEDEWNNSALQIIDVSEPFSPVIIGSVEIPGGGYDRRGVTVVGDTAYVTSCSAGLQIIDVSVPSSPIIIGSADTPGSALGVTMVGNTAYVADGSGGLQIIDVSIPSVPAIIGSAATPGSARDVMVIDNIAYVADGLKGLLMIDVSIPSSPVIIGSVPTRLHARGVAVIGDTAYIADDEYGLTIVSVPLEIESVNVVNASTINVTLPSPYMPGNYTIRVFNDQGEWSELPGVVHFSDLETNQYTVTFLDHDESALKVETVLHGCDATAPEAPTREGHAFTGWDKVFDTITEDLTVTAMYDKLTYHVIYTSAGNGTINGPTPQTVTHGDSSEPVTAQPDTGYHFVQWSDGSTANPRTDTNVTADITVTAVFDYVKGDVNLDGKVNMKDAILLIQYAAGLADLTDAQKKRGNICGHENDNNVGMADAILIFGIIARSH
jgi:hypothetical protein